MSLGNTAMSASLVTFFRLKTEDKDTQTLPPLNTGGLSPIMDMDEDISGTLDSAHMNMVTEHITCRHQCWSYAQS